MSQPTPDALREVIRETNKLVNYSKPFGVNITMTPNIDKPDLFAYAQAAVDEGKNPCFCPSTNLTLRYVNRCQNIRDGRK